VSQASRRLLGATLLFLYALGLRVSLLGKHPFHMDEALYAGFSNRILHGDLLLTGGLNNDKPPLQPYLGALGMALFGNTESGVRFMDCLVSALECAVLCWFLWPLAGAMLALAAGLCLAGAPLAASYGASGLMDSPMSLFLLLSFCLAASAQPWGAGLAWGLAAASKQTAWFLLPWVALAAWASAYAPRASIRHFIRGAAWVLLPLGLWSVLFQHPRLGMILLMRANQPEVGFSASGAGARLAYWLQAGLGLFQAPWIFPLLALGGLLGSLVLGFRWRKHPELRAWALAGTFVPVCLALYVALNMRPFDRYLLPLASFAALAFALPLAELSRDRPLIRWAFLPLLLALLLANRGMAVPGTQQGVGYAANDGFDAAARELKRRCPTGGALYSTESGVHWMGNYYLGKGWKLVENQDSQALSQSLAQDLGAGQVSGGEGEAFLICRTPGAPLAPAGWTLNDAGQFGDWRLFKIEPRRQGGR
jgi:4-amino-4-deoxy-L-arabinose transferase-like glycosyltransferase